ncbi:hypothetical protein Tco_0250961 [Tanacetum coccineum]
MHQTFEKKSLAMTRKLDDMIELPKSQPKKTYKEDLEYEMVLVKIPKCISWLDSNDAYDEAIGSLGEDEWKSCFRAAGIGYSHASSCYLVQASKAIAKSLAVKVEVVVQEGQASGDKRRIVDDL